MSCCISAPSCQSQLWMCVGQTRLVINTIRSPALIHVYNSNKSRPDGWLQNIKTVLLNPEKSDKISRNDHFSYLDIVICNWTRGFRLLTQMLTQKQSHLERLTYSNLLIQQYNHIRLVIIFNPLSPPFPSRDSKYGLALGCLDSWKL